MNARDNCVVHVIASTFYKSRYLTLLNKILLNFKDFVR